jgi:hypothetical protein
VPIVSPRWEGFLLLDLTTCLCARTCAQVFMLGDGGVPVLTSKGSYYKNVRKEWASLVSTPASARFQDALVRFFACLPL